MTSTPPLRFADHLTPRNATPLVRVLAGAGARLDGMPVEIDKLKDPLDVPAAFLPHLAYEYSTDIWSKRWTEDRRRAVADAAIALQQRKGTLYTIKEYARYVEGSVIGIERPPMGVFSGPSLTRAEREAWLATLPQIRLWRVREQGTAGLWKSFYGSNKARRMSDASFCFGNFATPSTASSRLQARARWVVGGIETTIKVTNYGSEYQIALSGTAGDRVFSGDPCGIGFFIPSDAWKRLVRIAPKSRLAWRSAVTPALQAVTSEPERVIVSGNAGAGVFSGDPCRMGFFVPSTAPLRIYERYAVLTPDAPTPRRPTVQFMGIGRYGFAPHTAYIRVSLPGKRPDFAAGEGITGLRKRYWLPHDDRPLADLCAALVASKRLSDKIMLRIGPEPLLMGGRPARIGIDKVVIGGPAVIAP